MKIVTLDTAGIQPAIYAMRNPMNSNHMTDSKWVVSDFEKKFVIGEKDKELSLKLQKAGPEHCKHLRMIVTWVDITADLAFYKQLDTYRYGVEKNSTSTMHKLVSKDLVLGDFELVKAEPPYWPGELTPIVGWLNAKMLLYREEKDTEKKKLIWKEIINLLPSSYLQRRTYMFSYAALRNIVKQREGHKMTEWAQFIEWAKSLPESWMIFE